MKTVKFPKRKNEAINKAMKFMNERYGTDSFDIRWEIGLAQWELRSPAGFCGAHIAYWGLPLLVVCRYNPTVIVFNSNDINYRICIDTQDDNWEELMAEQLDRVFLKK